MFKIIEKYPFLGHLFFWLGFLLLYIVSGKPDDGHQANAIFGITVLIPQLIAAYLTVYYILPQLLLKKKYIQFFIWMILSVYIIAALTRVLVVHVAEPMVITGVFEQESIFEILTDWGKLVTHYFPMVYNVVGFFWLFTYSKKSMRNIALKKEKTAAELKALKSQLNPHFLFNTLNNIYSLSLDNSPKTSESIGKLSEILDYILYRCDSKFVSLADEIKLLENYIDLEKLRYDDRLQVTFQKQVESNVQIAPLVLLSLVENAFKHGAGEDGGSPIIYISLTAKQNLFTFVITNSLIETLVEKPKATIGLENIKKQLDLLYPNKYQLKIEKQANLFTVTLILKL